MYDDWRDEEYLDLRIKKYNAQAPEGQRLKWIPGQNVEHIYGKCSCGGSIVIINADPDEGWVTIGCVKAQGHFGEDHEWWCEDEDIWF